jgi:hypothetical protein
VKVELNEVGKVFMSLCLATWNRTQGKEGGGGGGGGGLCAQGRTFPRGLSTGPLLSCAL